MLLRLVYTTWQEAIRAIVTQLQAFDQTNTTNLDGKAALAGSASQSFSMLNGTVAGTMSMADAHLTTSSTNSTHFELINTATSGRTWVLYSSGGGPAAAGSFGIYDATAALNRMTIDANGAVGVLRVISSTGVILGSYTTATRPAHAAGLTIHVTDGGAGAIFQGSDGTAWANLG